MKQLKTAYGGVRNNWRIVLLVVLVLLATYFLFVPGATIGGETGGFEGDGEADRLTNLQFGIDLAGGSRVIAPVHGVTAEDITFESVEEADEIGASVAEYLNVSGPDHRTDAEAGTIEIFDPDVTIDQLRDALLHAGLTEDEFSGPREGVTSATRSDIITVLNNRLDAAGFAGGSVTEQTMTGVGAFIAAEWPGTLAELREAMADRGAVQVVAHYPDGDGWDEAAVLDGQQDIAGVDSVRQDGDLFQVPVTVTSDQAPTFVELLQEGGFDQPEAVGACDYGPDNDEMPQERPEEGSWGYCLLVIQDGEVLAGYGITDGLRQTWAGADPSFIQNPTFLIQTQERADAEQVRINLQEGALAAQLNLDDSTDMEISPALAERFLQNSLLTGLVAILAVVMMVFFRYGDPRVAAPMSITALSELYLLLGFAAAIGMSLDLAIMAGFIAVVGTGVDDLIIIADEVMGKHDVHSQRVFDSRFRKAFWVIGAAAATTILAMSPLAIMDLGDLRGFAIVTILGVLIGVLLTRPAYGNILRLIKTDK